MSNGPCIEDKYPVNDSQRIFTAEAEKQNYLNRAGSAKAAQYDPCGTAYARQTAQDSLREIISGLRLKLNQLEALQRALPQEMSLPADEILQQLINQLRVSRPDKY